MTGMSLGASKRPPRIGLTTYREPAAWGVWSEDADLLPATYADAVAVAGGLPLLLPPAAVGDVHTAADAVLHGLDGLVLTGGPDVDPAHYAAAPDPATGPPRSSRDGWELTLARAALRHGMPLLGVCRGMQVLAVALGGTLIQHLPDVVGTEVHSPTVGVHGRHDVALAEGSRLAGILGPRTTVATYHHQAVQSLPESTVATGWADDGIIEAFEICGAAWAIGVQWHPEVHDGEALFVAFAAASAAWRDGLAMPA